MDFHTSQRPYCKDLFTYLRPTRHIVRQAMFYKTPMPVSVWVFHPRGHNICTLGRDSLLSDYNQTRIRSMSSDAYPHAAANIDAFLQLVLLTVYMLPMRSTAAPPILMCNFSCSMVVQYHNGSAPMESEVLIIVFYAYVGPEAWCCPAIHSCSQKSWSVLYQNTKIYSDWLS